MVWQQLETHNFGYFDIASSHKTLRDLHRSAARFHGLLARQALQVAWGQPDVDINFSILCIENMLSLHLQWKRLQPMHLNSLYWEIALGTLMTTMHRFASKIGNHIHGRTSGPHFMAWGEKTDFWVLLWSCPCDTFAPLAKCWTLLKYN
jgi:hypothetical protein